MRLSAIRLPGTTFTAAGGVYRHRKALLGAVRQALHCAKQSFAVPVYTPLPDGIRVEMPLQLRTVTVESPLPLDMEALFS